MNGHIVVALGGNALESKNGNSASAQQAAAVNTAKQIVSLIELGYQVTIVHGNGPQVGAIMLHEEAIDTEELPSMPLDSCVAMSQGMIGYWLQQAIDNEAKQNGLDLKIATITTQTIVDEADPAFSNPSKPIGPFYSEEEASQVAQKKGFSVRPDSDRGWRRVVPSPAPVKVVESSVIKQLADQNFVVIAGGGGGVPVVNKDNKYFGIEAVVDKDLTAALVAETIGADILLILTPIDYVKINFNKPDEYNLEHTTIEELSEFISQGQFAVGSMLPKIEASINFVSSKRGQRKAIIASLDNSEQAMNGQSGTIIE